MISILFGLLAAPLQAQQAVYFDGTNQSFLSFPSQNMPSGNQPRTLEFWMKSDYRPDAVQNHESIIELGTQTTAAGSAFGIFTELTGTGAYRLNYLGFRGYNMDQHSMIPIFDDEWHFVSVIYDGATLVSYLDGNLDNSSVTASPSYSMALATDISGPCYIGGNPNQGWMFKGAVRGVSIWNVARSKAQIQKDMIPFFGTVSPFALTASEPGLIAYFPLNESSGATFQDIGQTISGTFANDAQWTTPISQDPNMTDEGVWFVIQNKHDVDADLGTPADRLAMRVGADRVLTIAPVPVYHNAGDFLDYAAFLWKIVRRPDGYPRLINKFLGDGYALDCGQQNPTIGYVGDYYGQDWTLENSNLSQDGLNAYILTNAFITSDKVVAENSAGQLVVTPRVANDTTQVWLFQPMNLVLGYHIPTFNNYLQSPDTKVLYFGYYYYLHGTDTTSDWAMLNAHLIYRNYFNALINASVIAYLLNPIPFLRREINIITKYDSNDVVAQYPINGGLLSQQAFTEFRGSSVSGSFAPGAAFDVSFVTEEMMCKTGVFWRGSADKTYREYDQVVHEFSHAIDVICNLDSKHVPANNWTYAPAEWFPYQVQRWFHCDFANVPLDGGSVDDDEGNNRALLDPASKAYLSTLFSPANTWIAPRKLRNREDPPSAAVALLPHLFLLCLLVFVV